MKKLWVENIEVLPAVLYQEAAPSGEFTDKSNDMLAWDIHGEKVIDYLFVLQKIRSILLFMLNPNYPTIDFSGWSSLSSQEKIVAAKYLTVPYAMRLTVITENQDIQNTHTLLGRSYGIQNAQFRGRVRVVESMRRWVFVNYVRKDLMSLEVSKQFGVDTFPYLNTYERFNTSDFYKWLTNMVGTPFELDGFAQKSYYSEQLRDELLAIYNGEVTP